MGRKKRGRKLRMQNKKDAGWQEYLEYRQKRIEKEKKFREKLEECLIKGVVLFKKIFKPTEH